MTLSTVLFVVFLVLKLTGLIAWSWWWVTAPLWIGFVIVLPLWVFAGAITVATQKSDPFRFRRR